MTAPDPRFRDQLADWLVSNLFWGLDPSKKYDAADRLIEDVIAAEVEARVEAAATQRAAALAPAEHTTDEQADLLATALIGESPLAPLLAALREAADREDNIRALTVRLNDPRPVWGPDLAARLRALLPAETQATRMSLRPNWPIVPDHGQPTGKEIHDA